jgi:hypothetical protein
MPQLHWQSRAAEPATQRTICWFIGLFTLVNAASLATSVMLSARESKAGLTSELARGDEAIRGVCTTDAGAPVKRCAMSNPLKL